MIFKDIKTDRSLLLTMDERSEGNSLRGDVWVVDFCYEAHFGGFEGVFIWYFNINFICPTYISLLERWDEPSYGVITGPLNRPRVNLLCGNEYLGDALNHEFDLRRRVQMLSPTGTNETPEIGSE